VANSWGSTPAIAKFPWARPATLVTYTIDHYLCLRNWQSDVSYSSVCLPARGLVGTKRRGLRSRASGAKVLLIASREPAVGLIGDWIELVPMQALNFFDEYRNRLSHVLGLTLDELNAGDVSLKTSA
jgi:hypothetical protein